MIKLQALNKQANNRVGADLFKVLVYCEVRLQPLNTTVLPSALQVVEVC
jgi:hypothetical protein